MGAGRSESPRRTQAKGAGEPRAPRRSPSWISLLASTTLVGSEAETVEAEIRASGREVRGIRLSARYLLVVQSYDGKSAKPVGSVLRSVTGAELRAGVRVALLEVRDSSRPEVTASARVVAWVQRGVPDLEFDGRRARPQPGSLYGEAIKVGRAVRIDLDKRLAA